jgi:tetratricopeptide (TPR) repeat protein
MSKRHIFVLAIFVAASFTVSAQTEKIAELEKRLSSVSGKEQVTILNELSEEYSFQSVEKAVAYAQRALDLAKSLSDLEGEGQALQNIADAYNEMGQFARALEFFSRAEAVFQKNGNKKALAKCINNSGVVYARMGNVAQGRDCFLRSLAIMTRLNDEFEIASCEVNLGIISRKLGQPEAALEHYRKALPIFEKLKEESGVATTLGNIGLTYKDLGKYDQAIEFYLRALKIEEKNKNKAGLARVLGNIGNIYKNMNNNAKALDFFKRSLALQKEIGAKTHIAGQSLNIGDIFLSEKNFARAVEYFQAALDIWRQINNPQGQAQALGNLAAAFREWRKLDRALDYAYQALALNEKIGLEEGVLVTLKIIADTHADRKEYGQALKFLQRGLAIAQARKEQLLIRDFYDSLSSVTANMGNYRQALAHFHSYVQAKDAILNQEGNDKIAELEAKYEAEKKQGQIELLSKDNEIQKLQLSRARFRTGALISGIGLLLIVFFLLFRRYLHLLAFWKKKNYVSHYKLERQIGSGAMGVVWQATDLTGKKRSVALKLIREEHASDPIQRKRFLNEAYLVDQLDHPNIIKVFERGEYQQTLFIAMELLSGKSLADVIRAGDRLPVSECLRIMRQLADALARIHGQGILHRDVKPANVMLSNRSEPRTAKLLDFGLAQSPSLTRLTETGEILGTVYYMAPELISQRQASAASDMYALGVVFYELLTLEKPFLGENPGEIIRAILEGKPITPDHFRPDLSAEQTALVMRLLGKDPGTRPTGEDLIDALAAAG